MNGEPYINELLGGSIGNVSIANGVAENSDTREGIDSPESNTAHSPSSSCLNSIHPFPTPLRFPTPNHPIPKSPYPTDSADQLTVVWG